MDFESAKKQFDRLSRLFQRGEIDQDEYIKGVDSLAVRDERGVEWQIGMQSGRWYRKEGEQWVQDLPPSSSGQSSQDLKSIGQNRLKRRLVAGLLVVIVLILLLILLNIGSNGLFEFGGPGLPTFAEVGESSVGPEADIPRSTADTTSNDQEQNSEVNEQTSLTSPPKVPNTPTGQGSDSSEVSVTNTLQSPSPIDPPQIWQEDLSFVLNVGSNISKEWVNFLGTPLEYEYLMIDEKTVLMLQLNGGTDFWLLSPSDTHDVDRSTKIAMPRSEGVVSMACRWNPETQSGYALRLTQQSWVLIKSVNGIETILLEGGQSSGFTTGNFETFRMACIGPSIQVWVGNRELGSATDRRFSKGAYGLQFSVDQGVAVIYIEEDRVLVRLEEGARAGLEDIVRLGSLDVQYLSPLKEYRQMSSGSQSGQSLIGVNLRIVNFGDQPVIFKAENIYLEKGDQRIFAYATPLDSASDAHPIIFPLTMGNGEKTGEIYFSGVNLTQLKDWELVVDLTDEGIGEARFRFLQ